MAGVSEGEGEMVEGCPILDHISTHSLSRLVRATGEFGAGIRWTGGALPGKLHRGLEEGVVEDRRSRWGAGMETRVPRGGGEGERHRPWHCHSPSQTLLATSQLPPFPIPNPELLWGEICCTRYFSSPVSRSWVKNCGEGGRDATTFSMNVDSIWGGVREGGRGQTP